MSTEFPPKGDLLHEIFSICTTLTDEAMKSVSAKAKEAGFDVNRGLIPLAESLINLSAARAVLEDAIDKQKLIHLPITVQRDVLANMEVISKSVQGLGGGVDEVVNLVNAVEALNTSIWKYGLHNLSNEVLGYQRKLNQLKNQELEISHVVTKLDQASKTAEHVDAAVADIQLKNSQATAFLEQVKGSSASSSTLLEQIKQLEAQVVTLHASIQQHEKQGGELTSNIKTAHNELASLSTSIQGFYTEVDEYRKKISQTSDDASRLMTTSESTLKRSTEDAKAAVDAAIESLQNDSKQTIESLASQVETALGNAADELTKLNSDTTTSLTEFQDKTDAHLVAQLETFLASSAKLTADSEQRLTSAEERLEERATKTVVENNSKTAQLIAELETLKGQIREQIQQATGFTLFGAFQARQNAIVKSKKVWAWAIFVVVAISAGVTSWIAWEAQSYQVGDLAFWVKLSLTIPLAFVIAFCTVQYGRERRLEEEYAFKASISVSLNPYRDLIHSILEKNGTADQSKYAEFVIESVKNVFTPPTDKVFDSEKREGLTQKTFEQAAKVIGTAFKAAK